MVPMKTDFRIVSDGGVKGGNPGQGYGSFFVESSNGEPDQLSRIPDMGRVTSNQAEYMALIAGAGFLAERICRDKKNPGTHSVEFVTDSRLIQGQLCKGWQINHEHLEVLHKEALETLEGFGEWSVTWVRRDVIVPILGH